MPSMCHKNVFLTSQSMSEAGDKKSKRNREVQGFCATCRSRSDKFIMSHHMDPISTSHDYSKHYPDSRRQSPFPITMATLY